jgi:hypothetical protein
MRVNANTDPTLTRVSNWAVKRRDRKPMTSDG